VGVPTFGAAHSRRPCWGLIPEGVDLMVGGFGVSFAGNFLNCNIHRRSLTQTEVEKSNTDKDNTVNNKFQVSEATI